MFCPQEAALALVFGAVSLMLCYAEHFVMLQLPLHSMSTPIIERFTKGDEQSKKRHRPVSSRHGYWQHTMVAEAVSQACNHK